VNTGTRRGRRSRLEWLSSLPVALLLLAVIFFGVSEGLHSRLLAVGEHTWHSYFLLRANVSRPSCNPNPNVSKRVEQEFQQQKAQSSGGLFSSGPPSRGSIRKSILANRQQCREQWRIYHSNRSRTTLPLRIFRSVETFVGGVTDIGLTAESYLLVLLIMFAAATATVTRHHIVLRPATTALDHRVTSIAQLVANAMLLVSHTAFTDLDYASGRVSDPGLHLIWIAGFAVMTLVSLVQVLRPPRDAEPGGDPLQALLSIPLYTAMTLVAGGYFLIAQAHPAAIAIYMSKMQSYASLFLNVGLYVWVGMLLKQTRLARLVFDVIRPWRLPPELVAMAVVLLTAVPTAYTGASGIFVIAVGAVIYEELRLAGARRQLALATTAMSGSAGVVLNPCLLVVIVAALNKQVTTDQLFGWGVYVFLLSVTLFSTMALLTRRNPIRLARPREAVPASLRALLPLAPYLLVGALMILACEFLLGLPFNEFTTPVILPLTLLGIVLYDRLSAKRRSRRAGDDAAPAGVELAVRSATTEACGHIGALLILMGLSISIGGLIQRADLMSLFPATFASPWTAMLALVVVMVIIGMIMDPYGAVILVSSTIATVAYRSGINPVHFWMVVLTAFELGYLTPPVALNHLLTRQVVGEEEVAAATVEHGSFWHRHERLMLPITTQALVLLLVAFVPLIISHGF